MTTLHELTWVAIGPVPVSAQRIALSPILSQRSWLRKVTLSLRPELEAGAGMLLQVAPDARAVVQHRDPVILEMRRRPDPAQHQQVRRIVGPARDDHLAPRADHLRRAAVVDLDPDAALALEHQLADQHPRTHVEVPPPDRRLEIGRRRADPAAVAVDRLLAARETLGAYRRQGPRWSRTRPPRPSPSSRRAAGTANRSAARAPARPRRGTAPRRATSSSDLRKYGSTSANDHPLAPICAHWS